MNALRLSCQQLQQSGRATSKAITGVASYCRSRTSPPALSSAPPDSLASWVWRSGPSIGFFSTEPEPPPPHPPPSLYQRIESVRDPKTSIIPVLDQWVREGNPVGERLRFLVARLKSYKRFHHALQISNWMSARCIVQFSSKDAATKLELVYRVHGLADAENYFNNLSEKMKWRNVYGALLSIYVQEKCVEKAEAVVQEMKEKSMGCCSFPFNLLISLYYQVGDFHKLDPLLEQMQKEGIPYDKYTRNNLISAYSAASNIPRMEEIIHQIEENPLDSGAVSWDVYTTAASGYLNVGLTDKALAMLKKAEEKMPKHRRATAVEFLLTLYTKAGDKGEVHRVWNAYKPTHEPFAILYACMITCLSKLNDLEGAESIHEEFESNCSVYDFRVLNKLLVAYCKRGLMEKGESVLEEAAERRVCYASSWHILASGYVNHGLMGKAVEMLKRALSVGRRSWRPSPAILDSCFEYLEKQGDVDGMEELAQLLKEEGPLSRELYHRFVRTYRRLF
ncbi:unnamed protein product [Linum tenue]|uniref:Pentatricopeptide repeat-containing protein n=1 Tax=Linum tenue TaxID=586396 RepID=A0AAV0P5H4_9ROSI|nr:unnamed protein product [Linum tenue]